MKSAKLVTSFISSSVSVKTKLKLDIMVASAPSKSEPDIAIAIESKNCKLVRLVSEKMTATMMKFVTTPMMFSNMDSMNRILHREMMMV